jgi:glycine/D-amino acid oxidase-like deaminating enzyme
LQPQVEAQFGGPEHQEVTLHDLGVVGGDVGEQGLRRPLGEQPGAQHHGLPEQDLRLALHQQPETAHLGGSSGDPDRAQVHAFLSPAEACHHLAAQRETADGNYPMPDDITTGTEAHLLDEALSPRVRAAYLVEGECVVDPEAFARGLSEALGAAGVKVHENAEVTGFRTQEGASPR